MICNSTARMQTALWFSSALVQPRRFNYFQGAYHARFQEG